MSREFENIWKDAFEGASITPSEEVWGKVVDSMDSNSGRRSWVTILLIAATVTMAFAFPLTIGNSEFELKPQEAELANTSQEVLDQSVVLESDVDEQASKSIAEVDLAEKSAEPTLVAREEISEVNQTANLLPIEGEEITEADAIDLLSYQPLLQEPRMSMEEYYILPIFEKTEDQFNRNLLAYSNINSGRQTTSSGLGEMNFLAAQADNELASPERNFSDFTNGSEEGGASFYIGGGVELPMAKRLNLTAGLGFQTQRLNGSSNMVYEENEQQIPLGIYDPILPGTIFLTESYEYTSVNQFISLPIGAKYALVNKKTKFRMGLALSPDFMISHKVTSMEYGSNKTKPADTGYNTIQLTGLIGFDLLFPVSNSYGLAIETGLRQGLVPNAQNGSQYTTSFNFGVILFYQIK